MPLFVVFPQCYHSTGDGGAAGAATADGKSPWKPQERDMPCPFSGQVCLEIRLCEILQMLAATCTALFPP